MGAARVIKAFDIVEDFGASLVVGGKVATVDELQFEGAPEAFPGGIVVAIAPAAHGWNDVGLSQRSSEITRGVLNAPIRVEEEIRRGIVMAQGHAEGVEDQGGIDRLAPGPTDDLAAVEVEDR